MDTDTYMVASFDFHIFVMFLTLSTIAATYVAHKLRELYSPLSEFFVELKMGK